VVLVLLAAFDLAAAACGRGSGGLASALLVVVLLRPRLDLVGLSIAVAIDANDEAAPAARPVVVEQVGVAHVTHLADTLYHSLPGYQVLFAAMELNGAPFLLDNQFEVGLDFVDDEPSSLFAHAIDCDVTGTVI